jgi:hypothetical protein
VITDIITRMLTDSDSTLLEPVPDPAAVDYFAALVKLGISVIPDWGGPASELFGMLTAPLLGKRRDDWFEELRLRLNNLSAKVGCMTIESLARNEEFVSVVVQATQAAIKTHQQEKVEALRNAVLNVAAGGAPAENLSSLFVSYVDSFSPKHLEVLCFFGNRSAPALEALRKQRDISDVAVVDLNNRGLIRDTRPYAARGRDGYDSLIVQPWEITSLRTQFLKFITAPEAIHDTCNHPR